MNTQELFDRVCLTLENFPVKIDVNNGNTVIIFKNSVYGYQMRQLQEEFDTDMWYSPIMGGLVIG